MSGGRARPGSLVSWIQGSQWPRLSGGTRTRSGCCTGISSRGYCVTCEPSVLAKLPPSVLATLPTSVLAKLPPSIRAELPASVLAQLPVS